jgi:hypothetical protein
VCTGSCQVGVVSGGRTWRNSGRILESSQCLSDWYGQEHTRRGISQSNARIHVCSSARSDRKFVGGERLGNDGIDGALLSKDVEERHVARRTATRRATIPHERQAMGVAILLGVLHIAG